MVCLYYIIKRKEMIHIATELKTSITYTGTGSQKLFDIPFDYLRTSFVKTNVDDIVLTYGEDYVIINRQIEFTVAPISGSHVVIYRETTTDRLVSWADASVLKASDMTINQAQQLHILEEQQDWTKTNSIVMEGTIGWNARFHRIINVGDPVEPQDAVTKQYVEDVKTGFISEMIKVKNSAITEITDIKNKAIEAINNLKASTETYLTQLKDTFKSFVTEKTEEVNSLKESAVNETTNVKNTAIEELTAIKNAAVNETTEIRDEAVAAKNTAVGAAATAAASQSAVAASAETAQASAESASSSANAALESKNEALTSENNAKASETKSAKSEENAKAAETAAENSKKSASDSASAASSSAESALASKNAAAASQSSAAASAETAQASAESASSSANAALESKNEALTSENNAKASETKSAKSEENAKAAETAAENSKKSASDSASAASSSAESALESKKLAAASANSASASKTSAESSAKSAASSATTATKQADRAQDIADSLEGLAGITGIATTEEAIAGVVDNKAMTPLKTKKAIEQGTNVFTALNTFRANIAVSSGTTAGSSGSISFGISPADETVQARIGTDNLGGLFYNASTSQAHVFSIGTNNDVLSIRSDTSKMSLISNKQAFATVTHTGVAKWLGNANTATKLETARKINGVAFDGTKDITIYNTEGHLVFPNGAEFWIG